MFRSAVSESHYVCVYFMQLLLSFLFNRMQTNILSQKKNELNGKTGNYIRLAHWQSTVPCLKIVACVQPVCNSAEKSIHTHSNAKVHDTHEHTVLVREPVCILHTQCICLKPHKKTTTEYTVHSTERFKCENIII